MTTPNYSVDKQPASKPPIENQPAPGGTFNVGSLAAKVLSPAAKSSKEVIKMHSGRINTLLTSQDQPCFVWHHTGHNHAAGNGSITTHVKLPATEAYTNGFPTGYAVSVTPSQPCAASVSNRTPTVSM